MTRSLVAASLGCLATLLLAGCPGEPSLIDVASIRLDQNDPEATLRLAMNGLAQLQLEMGPGRRYLLRDYKSRADSNFKGYIVCGDALELMNDPHAAALAYWSAANFMRRVPISPAVKGQYMRDAFTKLESLYARHNLGGSAKLAQANTALVDVYANSAVVMQMDQQYQAQWTREQQLLDQRQAAVAELLAAQAELFALAFYQGQDKQWKLARARQRVNLAQGTLNRISAALDAGKLAAAPEQFPLIRKGNYPATMAMHFFANFVPNQRASTMAVANVLRGYQGPAAANATAAANAAAAGNVQGMIADFATLEQQTYFAEAAGS